MLFLLILGILIGAVSVVFALQNISIITVAFLFWHFDGSLSVILLLAIVAGMLMSVLVSVPEIIKDQMKLRTSYKREKALEDEIEHYKKLVAELPSPLL